MKRFKPTFKPEDIIGMTLDDAKKNLDKAKFRSRVVRQDGKSFIITADFEPTRLNIEIEKGIVKSFYLG